MPSHFTEGGFGLADRLGKQYLSSEPDQARLRRGQVFTTDALCDLMIALCIRGDEQTILDAGCGSGAFLMRLANALMRAHGLSASAVLEMLYGLDLDPHAAQLAQQQLQAICPAAEVKLEVHNFIGPTPNGWPETFDVIIGNPPYLRHEHVAQSQAFSKIDAAAYLKMQYQAYLAEFPEQAVLFGKTADLYIWFFLRATLLLKPGGRLAFVTSNSWMNTVLGQAFQRFLLHHYQVQALLESACERWFADAAVNPVILVLQKKEKPPEESHNEESGSAVRMLRFPEPLAIWLPSAGHQNDPTDYWKQIAVQIENQAQIKPVSSTRSWALPLRGNAHLLNLLEGPERWMPLQQLGAVRYPLKTGINRFFYVDEQTVQHYGIEPEFLVPVIKSARQVKAYTLHATDTQQWLFSCLFSKDELKARGKTGALSYIQWGETQVSLPRQKRAQPVPWPQVPSVQHGSRPWYAIDSIKPADLLCNRFIDRRFFFALNEGGVVEDQTFYGLTLKQASHANLTAALLNGSLSYYWLELHARRNLGEGVLQFARRDMADFPCLNPTLYQARDRQAIETTFQALRTRPILPIEQELLSEDRIMLDEAMLSPWLGASATGIRECVAEALLNLVAERQALGRQRPTKPLP